jgi:hypothetical protein
LSGDLVVASLAIEHYLPLTEIPINLVLVRAGDVSVCRFCACGFVGDRMKGGEKQGTGVLRLCVATVSFLINHRDNCERESEK